MSAAKYAAAGGHRPPADDNYVVHAASVTRAPVTPASPFVKTAGTRFQIGGQNVVFAGTNAFYLLLDSTSDADVVKFFDAVAAKGATLVRFFAFTNGYGAGSVPMRTPLQPRVGVYDESQWKRMDMILATAAKYGIRCVRGCRRWWWGGKGEPLVRGVLFSTGCVTRARPRVPHYPPPCPHVQPHRAAGQL